MGTQQEYVLGTSPVELQRLGLQHRLWSDATHQLWLRAGVQPGAAVLDVGCGPGFAGFDLAQLVGPTGTVVGVDQSESYLAHLRQQAAARSLPQLRAYPANALELGSNADLRREAGALPRGGFDVAYARWLLLFIPDPAAVIRGVASLLRPGGRWAIQDYFNYEATAVAPRSAIFEKAIRATGASFRAGGGDPDIAGRLPALLEANGFALEHLAVNQRIARPGTAMWAWPDTFWSTYIHTLVDMGLLTPAERDQWRAEWARASATPTSFIFLPPVFDLVAVRR